MICRYYIEQFCADDAAAKAFEDLIEATFPDAEWRDSRQEIKRDGKARAAQHAALQAEVRPGVRAELTDEVTATVGAAKIAEGRDAMLDDLLTGKVVDPRITVKT